MKNRTNGGPSHRNIGTNGAWTNVRATARPRANFENDRSDVRHPERFRDIRPSDAPSQADQEKKRNDDKAFARQAASAPAQSIRMSRLTKRDEKAQTEPHNGWPQGDGR